MSFELWVRWDSEHGSPDQKKRVASATKAENTPVSIDPDGGCGQFSGSHGQYSTNLGSCSCGDFIRRQLPCKHMYRLAMELGLFEGKESVESDKRKVKRPASYGLSLKELVSRVENMTDEAQIYLKNTLLNMLFRKKDPIKLKPSVPLEQVIGAGILTDTEGQFTIDEQARKNIRKLYTYLLRKFDTESYFEPDTGDVVEIPKGATFVTTITIDGTSTDLQFPDDEITDLLDLFGVNRCRK